MSNKSIGGTPNVLLYMMMVDVGAYVTEQATQLVIARQTQKLRHNWCIVFCIMSALRNPSLRGPAFVALLTRLTPSEVRFRRALNIVRLVIYTLLFGNVVQYMPSQRITKATILPIIGFGGAMAIHHVEAIRCISQGLRKMFILDLGSNFMHN